MKAMRFLHIADVHLGYRQYKLAERERDFYLAFRDICDRYAIAEKVDFVLIAGDLFHTRGISATTYNYATHVLRRLANAGIPVVAIEGNHDFYEAGRSGSWYLALAQTGLLYFLHPVHGTDAEGNYLPLELGSKHLGGNYLDVGDVRIIGSQWHGFRTGQALEHYAKQAASLRDDKYGIFAFHGGHEDYLAVNRGGVAGRDFSLIAEQVDYVALGHVHQAYRMDELKLYNPGSTEANNTAEAGIARGGYLVSTDGDATPIREFRQRPFWLPPSWKARRYGSMEELCQDIASGFESSLTNQELAPVLQIRIDAGRAPFERDNSVLQSLKVQLEGLGALHCSVIWESGDALGASWLGQRGTDELHQRSELERSLLDEILAQDGTVSDKSGLREEILSLRQRVTKDTSAEELLGWL